MRRHGQPAAVLVGLSFSESAKAANFAVYAAASDSRAPMLFKAPMLAAWTWAGPYLGGTIGYSAGKSRTDTIFGDPASGAGLFATTASRDLDGAIGGAQAGYNWLAGMWLAGIEGDLNYSGQRAKLNAVCPGEICNPALIGVIDNPSVIANFEDGQKLEWFATLRARLGITVTPDAIAYVTGGLAVGEVMTAGTVFGFDGFGNHQHDRRQPQHQGGLDARRRPRGSFGRQLDRQDRVPLPRSWDGHDHPSAGAEFDDRGGLQFPRHRQCPARRRQLQIRSKRNPGRLLIGSPFSGRLKRSETTSVVGGCKSPPARAARARRRRRQRVMTENRPQPRSRSHDLVRDRWIPDPDGHQSLMGYIIPSCCLRESHGPQRDE
jgi:opacity protein-like surface antigen